LTQADCLVCREHRGDLEVPGGFLWDDDLVVAFHVPPLDDSRGAPYLGHLLVTTRRHVDQLGDLTDDEAARVGVVAARLAKALRERHDATRVHCGLIGGLANAHFHLHLLPRYPETPPDVRWNEVDEWDGARRGGAREVTELVERLRAG
jgi:histidine triad (HIT) family protein